MRLRHKEGLNESLEAEHHSLASLVVIRRAHTTKEAIEDLLWVVFAIFIVYLGDCQTNLVSILLWDPRIDRTALLLGLSGVSLNVGFILYSTFLSSYRLKFHKEYEPSNIEAPTLLEEKPEFSLKITRFLLLIGIPTFCMLLYALWPIWRYLSILLLLSLLMSSTAMSPYFVEAIRHNYLAFVIPQHSNHPRDACMEERLEGYQHFPKEGSRNVPDLWDTSTGRSFSSQDYTHLSPSSSG